MKRRDLLTAGSVGVPVAITGCLDRTDTAGSDDDDEEEREPAEEREFPDHPFELDEESALEYVQEYEEVHQHNERVGGGRSSISTDCPPVLDHEAAEGYYVSTVCWVSYWDMGGVGEGHSDEVLYLVTPNETVRIEPEEYEYEDPYLADGQVPNDALGLWLSNFDDEPHELAVQVVHEASEGPIEVLDETFVLPAEDGIVVVDVAGVPHYYEVRAERADGAATSERFRISSHDWGSDALGAVHVTPGGDVTARDISFERR